MYLVFRERCQNYLFHLELSNVPHHLKKIHSDVWGPSPVKSLDGYKYYVLFIDEYTRYVWIFPLMNKSDLFSVFVKFYALMNKSDLQTDGGGEYISNQFK